MCPFSALSNCLSYKQCIIKGIAYGNTNVSTNKIVKVGGGGGGGVPTNRIVKGGVLNSFKPGIPFMGHRQTE